MICTKIAPKPHPLVKPPQRVMKRPLSQTHNTRAFKPAGTMVCNCGYKGIVCMCGYQEPVAPENYENQNLNEKLENYLRTTMLQNNMNLTNIYANKLKRDPNKLAKTF